ncbi:hypothetical protein FB451DRAFT_138367 [Mycena latifolia]|nr:hypothetical protein FB451DRAFT_138367 [Mycena latifolia]
MSCRVRALADLRRVRAERTSAATYLRGVCARTATQVRQMSALEPVALRAHVRLLSGLEGRRSRWSHSHLPARGPACATARRRDDAQCTRSLPSLPPTRVPTPSATASTRGPAESLQRSADTCRAKTARRGVLTRLDKRAVPAGALLHGALAPESAGYPRSRLPSCAPRLGPRAQTCMSRAHLSA